MGSKNINRKGNKKNRSTQSIERVKKLRIQEIERY